MHCNERSSSLMTNRIVISATNRHFDANELFFGSTRCLDALDRRVYGARVPTFLMRRYNQLNWDLNMMLEITNFVDILVLMQVLVTHL